MCRVIYDIMNISTPREIKIRYLIKGKWSYLNLNTIERGMAFSEIMNQGYEARNLWIGLHDPKGKEIYEGDILGYPNDDNGIVIWDNICSSFRLKFRDNDRVMISLQIGDKGLATVIGNIYQNKELLK